MSYWGSHFSALKNEEEEEAKEESNPDKELVKNSNSVVLSNLIFCVCIVQIEFIFPLSKCRTK